jgi:hypothetical protein
MTDGPHRDLMLQAIAREGQAHRAALQGDGGATAYGEAADLYRASWELAPPGAYGRLIGMLKAAILSGAGAGEAAYVREVLAAEAEANPSPPAAYALALAALVVGDDAGATRHTEAMRGASGAFDRAAAAVGALATADGPAYRFAVQAIVEDFAARAEHLTGVPIADTAAMLEALAARRGMAAGLASPLLPPRGG